MFTKSQISASTVMTYDTVSKVASPNSILTFYEAGLLKMKKKN